MQSRLVAPLAALLIAGTLGLAGCSSGSGSASTSAGPTAASAPAQGSALDAAGFAAALKRPGTVVLDVRTPAEFAQGHLPGAQLADVNAPNFAAIVGALPKDTPYAVYCRSGNRSATALQIMQGLGFTQTYHLAGGIGAWTSAGGDTVTG